MARRFAKYEGLGNDFVILEAKGALSAADVVRLCDRRRGIGADGVLVIGSSLVHDASMSVFNADGSQPEMCGNGIRCVALHIAAARGLDRADLTIATAAGPRRCLVERDGARATVRVDMGVVTYDGDITLDVDGATLQIATANAGNPHAILFGEHSPQRVDELGPRLAAHSMFAGGTNVEFARVTQDGIDLVVWERGVGRTLACGTGACATAVVAHAKRLVSGRIVRVTLPGGDLEIEPGGAGPTFMTGPAAVVFHGATDFEAAP